MFLTLAANTSPAAGMAMFGKTAFALLIILAIIFGLAWLLRRVGGTGGLPGQRLKLVSSLAVGQRERVVVVQLEQTWLVLGVGGGQVTRLHEMPAPEDADDTDLKAVPDSFAQRLAQVLARKEGP